MAESPARGRASQAQHKVVLRQSAVRKSPRKATASETLKSPTTGRASNRIIGKGSVSSPGMEEEGESDFEESMEEEEHNTSPVKKRKASNAQFQIEREQTSESGTDEEENGEEKENSGGAASEAKVRHPTGMVDDLFDDAPEEDEEMEEEMLAEPNQSDRRITRSSPGSALRKSVGRKELKGAELIASRIAKVQKTIAQGEIELEDEENDEVPSPTSTRR